MFTDNSSRRDPTRRIHPPDGIDVGVCLGSNGHSCVSIDGDHKVARAITAEAALRPAKFLGTSSAFWVGSQAEHDLEEAERAYGRQMDREVKCIS